MKYALNNQYALLSQLRLLTHVYGIPQLFDRAVEHYKCNCQDHHSSHYLVVLKHGVIFLAILCDDVICKWSSLLYEQGQRLIADTTLVAYATTCSQGRQ